MGWQVRDDLAVAMCSALLCSALERCLPTEGGGPSRRGWGGEEKARVGGDWIVSNIQVSAGTKGMIESAAKFVGRHQPWPW